MRHGRSKIYKKRGGGGGNGWTDEPSVVRPRFGRGSAVVRPRHRPAGRDQKRLSVRSETRCRCFGNKKTATKKEKAGQAPRPAGFVRNAKAYQSS
jgi:hypothetical protein